MDFKFNIRTDSNAGVNLKHQQLANNVTKQTA